MDSVQNYESRNESVPRFNFKNTGLRRLFNEARKRYKLSGIELYVFKNIAQFKNDYCRAIYVPEYQSIVMRSYKLYPSNIRYMLHEMCHALQHKEGRLYISTHNSKRSYSLEIEAEVFARVEYRKWYEKDYGQIQSNWNLASYSSYFGEHRFSRKKPTMSPNSLYEFVDGLRGKYKKPIIKKLDRTNIQTDWEEALCKINL